MPMRSVTVAILCLTGGWAIPALAEEACVMRGRVVDAQSGEAVRKTEVRLMRYRPNMNDNGRPVQAAATVSDQEGGFCLEGKVEADDYLLAGEKTGYLITRFGATGPGQVGTVLSVAAGQTFEGLTLRLIPQAVIAGKVVDAEGEPLNGLTVQAWRRGWLRGKKRDMAAGRAQTNDLGEYRLTGLSAGQYVLSAQPVFMFMRNANVSGNEPAPMRTYYPTAGERKDAAALQLKAGQNLTGADIQMLSAIPVHLRGQITGDLQGTTATDLAVSVVHVEEGSYGYPTFRTAVNEDGTFELGPITPGLFGVVVNAGGRRRFSVTPETIEVGTAGAEGVVLKILPAVSVKGQVRVDGASAAENKAGDLARFRVSLMSERETAVSAYGQRGAPVKADGSFAIEDIAPGSYYLQATGPPGTYLDSARLGQRDVAAKKFDITANGSGELRLVFRYGKGQVNGTAAKPAAGNAAPVPCISAAVVLVSETVGEDGSGIYFGNVNQAGAFRFDTVRPGKYQAYALAEGHLGPLQDPDVRKRLAAKGVDVSVGEAKTEPLKLTFIPEDELLQIYGDAAEGTGKNE